MDLRSAKAETAEDQLVRINAAIYHALGFCHESFEAELKQANFLPALVDLRLDALLRLIRFLGSIQEGGRLRPQQIRSSTELTAAVEIATTAATVLTAWPQSFMEVLKRMLPAQVKSAADLNFHQVFGTFYRHLFRVLPRTEFGFLHAAFEKFVLDNWQGLVRGQHRWFSSAIRRSTQWMTAGEAEKTAATSSQRLGSLVRKGELEGIFVNWGPHRTECWIRRESLNKWIAKRAAELVQYVPCSEASRILGLEHHTLMKVAQAGLIRYVNGAESLSCGYGIYFLRDDVLRIKQAFEKYPVRAQHYTNSGELITLRYALQNYLGRDAGLPAAIRAVIDGKLVPVGYTKRFPGITGYLFRADDLRKYRPVRVEIPPGGFLNFKETARVLRTRKDIVRSLVNHGILSTLNESRNGFSKLLPAHEVLRFAENYIDASILAAHSADTTYRVKRYLRNSGLPILEIPVPARPTKIFLLKETAAKIQIPVRPLRQ